jgi:hypothetical protein
MSWLANLLVFRFPHDASPCPFLTPEAAEQACKAAALPWVKAFVRVLFAGRAGCRGWAEWDSGVDENERVAVAVPCVDKGLW